MGRNQLAGIAVVASFGLLAAILTGMALLPAIGIGSAGAPAMPNPQHGVLVAAANPASPAIPAPARAAPALAGAPTAHAAPAAAKASPTAAQTVAPVLASAVGPAAPPSGPPLTVDPGGLAAALSCPATFQSGKEPILLVPGVAETVDQYFSWNYGQALPAAGFDVCTLAQPDLARGDFQLQAQYVVSAIRSLARRTHGKVDVLAASFGGLASRAALKWWPDTQGLVDDLVMLGTPNHGSLNFIALCAVGCPQSFWQARPGSNFLGVLNAMTETPGPLSYTSVFSRTDTGVIPEFPVATSAVNGGSNVAIQDICPARLLADHIGTLWDPAAYAVVIDALTHAGPADPARVDRSVCEQQAMPGVDPVSAMLRDVAWYKDVVATELTDRVPAEPPLQPWAVP